MVERLLNDGPAFRIVKHAFRADALERRLRLLGWDLVVTPTAGPFYWGTGRR